MACTGDFKNHSFQGGDRCVRCGTPKSGADDGGDGYELGSAPDPMGVESLSDLKQEFSLTEGQGKPKVSGTKWTQRRDKQKAQDEADKAIAKTTAKGIVQTLERAKGLGGYLIFGYSGDAFTLQPDEEKDLCALVSVYFEKVGFSLDDPRAIAFLFLAMEVSITSRQYAQMRKEIAQVTERVEKAAADAERR